MQQKLTLRLLPSEVQDTSTIATIAAQTLSVPTKNISGFYVEKHSIDARSKTIFVNLTIHVFVNEPFQQRPLQRVEFKNVARAKHTVIVVGAGPAGLFAALQLLEKGIKPIIIERGKDVRARRRDLAKLNKEGIINPESNYCFGEGGAGTYSDGKLYTRSNKRGSIDRILNLLVQFGADESILSDAHPHIGTNKLPSIITSIRETIIQYGGELLFEKKLADFVIEKDTVTGIITADGDKLKSDAVVLATGHSARDIFLLLQQKNISIESKPFALGVRVEHPQALIDSIQYHCPVRSEYLPPASYSLVEQTQTNKGVFSFCMCPGGIIAPAATSPEELVVNGWSPSKRNNPFANSGIVVQVDEQSAYHYLKQQQSKGALDKALYTSDKNPLLLMRFQQAVEQKAYKAGGGKFVAPAQKMVDFTNRKTSTNLPDCSYLPGIASSNLAAVLPDFIYNSLKDGFTAFGKKMKGYFTNDAVVVATESRTSSPIRIPRNADSLEHPQLKNLYPCGEGAGYAGGIVSAAMDGEKIALTICEKLLV